MIAVLRSFPALALVLVALAPPNVRAELDPATWQRALASLANAYQRGDAAAYTAALTTIAGDESPRAVDTVLRALDQAGQIERYDLAILLLARMAADAPRARLLELARDDGADWRTRYAALDVVSRWPDTGPILLAALDSARGEIRRQAVRMIGQAGLLDGVSRLIDKLALAERKGAADAREWVEALVVTTGTRFATGKDYRAWWDGLDFVGKDDVLARNRRAPEPTERKPGDDAGGSVESPLMRDWAAERPRDHRYVTSRKEGDIVVVQGTYDKVENVLDHLGIKYRTVTPQGLKDLTLDPAQIIVFNCTHTDRAGRIAMKGMLEGLPKGLAPEGAIPEGGMVFPGGAVDPCLLHDLGDDQIKRIRDFVVRGGFVFSSDWELGNVLARAFPEYLGVAGFASEDEVSIQPAKEHAGHELLRGVFDDNPYRKRVLRWKIDEASFLIDVKSPLVEPLVWSKELDGKYARKGLVACVFSPTARGTGSGGSVLHVLSHFEKQLAEDGDGYALQKMLLNFIARKQGWPAEDRPR